MTTKGAHAEETEQVYRRARELSERSTSNLVLCTAMLRKVTNEEQRVF